MTSGLDLVELQLRVAAGEPLRLLQGEVHRDGSAIECRIYAEDPLTLLPSPGTITTWRVPDGNDVRVDSGVEQGSVVSPLYDPLLAKLVVWAPDRHMAIRRMRGALDGVEVEGVKTNVPLLRRIIDHAEFVEGRYSTSLISTILA